jgi:hypothetical protein
VPLAAQRIVVAPIDVAVVSSGSRWGEVVTLVRFPTPWGKQSVAGAFLLIGAQDGAQPQSRPVRLTVARVLEPWSGPKVGWARLPRLSPPECTATVTGTTTDPLRLDVSEIVRRWAERGDDNQGIAVLACNPGPFSPNVASDPGAFAPRLDVYLR